MFGKMLSQVLHRSKMCQAFGLFLVWFWVRLSLIRLTFGLGWLGLALLGLDWLLVGLGWLGLAWVGLGWPGLAWVLG